MHAFILSGVTCGVIAGETTIISVSGTYYNNVAQFTCPSSYRLLGTSSRKCLQSGQWSNSHPRCASKLNNEQFFIFFQFLFNTRSSSEDDSMTANIYSLFFVMKENFQDDSL